MEPSEEDPVSDAHLRVVGVTPVRLNVEVGGESFVSLLACSNKYGLCAVAADSKTTPGRIAVLKTSSVFDLGASVKKVNSIDMENVRWCDLGVPIRFLSFSSDETILIVASSRSVVFMEVSSLLTGNQNKIGEYSLEGSPLNLCCSAQHAMVCTATKVICLDMTGKQIAAVSRSCTTVDVFRNYVVVGDSTGVVGFLNIPTLATHVEHERADFLPEGWGVDCIKGLTKDSLFVGFGSESREEYGCVVLSLDEAVKETRKFAELVYTTDFDRKAHYQVAVIPEWELCFVGTSNSSTIELLRRVDNVWSQVQPPEGYRPVLQDKESGDPASVVGMAVDLTSTTSYPPFDPEAPPYAPAPRLCVYSTDGTVWFLHVLHDKRSSFPADVTLRVPTSPVPSAVVAQVTSKESAPVPPVTQQPKISPFTLPAATAPTTFSFAPPSKPATNPTTSLPSVVAPSSTSTTSGPAPLSFSTTAGLPSFSASPFSLPGAVQVASKPVVSVPPTFAGTNPSSTLPQSSLFQAPPPLAPKPIVSTSVAVSTPKPSAVSTAPAVVAPVVAPAQTGSVVQKPSAMSGATSTKDSEVLDLAFVDQEKRFKDELSNIQSLKKKISEISSLLNGSQGPLTRSSIQDLEAETKISVTVCESLTKDAANMKMKIPSLEEAIHQALDECEDGKSVLASRHDISFVELQRSRALDPRLAEQRSSTNERLSAFEKSVASLTVHVQQIHSTLMSDVKRVPAVVAADRAIVYQASIISARRTQLRSLAVDIRKHRAQVGAPVSHRTSTASALGPTLSLPSSAYASIVNSVGATHADRARHSKQVSELLRRHAPAAREVKVVEPAVSFSLPKRAISPTISAPPPPPLKDSFVTGRSVPSVSMVPSSAAEMLKPKTTNDTFKQPPKSSSIPLPPPPSAAPTVPSGPPSTVPTFKAISFGDKDSTSPSSAGAVSFGLPTPTGGSAGLTKSMLPPTPKQDSNPSLPSFGTFTNPQPPSNVITGGISKAAMSAPLPPDDTLSSPPLSPPKPKPTLATKPSSTTFAPLPPDDTLSLPPPSPPSKVAEKLVVVPSIKPVGLSVPLPAGGTSSPISLQQSKSTGNSAPLPPDDTLSLPPPTSPAKPVTKPIVSAPTKPIGQSAPLPPDDTLSLPPPGSPPKGQPPVMNVPKPSTSTAASMSSFTFSTPSVSTVRQSVKVSNTDPTSAPLPPDETLVLPPPSGALPVTVPLPPPVKSSQLNAPTPSFGSGTGTSMGATVSVAPLFSSAAQLSSAFGTMLPPATSWSSGSSSTTPATSATSTGSLGGSGTGGLMPSVQAPPLSFGNTSAFGAMKPTSFGTPSSSIVTSTASTASTFGSATVSSGTSTAFGSAFGSQTTPVAQSPFGGTQPIGGSQTSFGSQATPVTQTSFGGNTLPQTSFGAQATPFGSSTAPVGSSLTSFGTQATPVAQTPFGTQTPVAQTPFGTQATPVAQTPFGSNTQLGGGSQTPFGTQMAPVTQTPFGSTPQSTFGAPSAFGNTVSGFGGSQSFGATSTFGSPSPFGAVPSGGSRAVLGGSAFGATSSLGAGTSPFGQPPQAGSIPTSVFGGGSQPNAFATAAQQAGNQWGQSTAPSMTSSAWQPRNV